MDNGYTSAVRDHVLCRKDLDFIANGNFVSNGYEECRNMQYFRINGMTRFWEGEQDLNVSALMGDILSGCVRHGVPFSYVITGDENGIRIYVGTLKLLRGSLISSYESLFPGIDIEPVAEDPLRTAPSAFGGTFTGVPTNKIGAEKKSFQIESICRGMQGRRFTYAVIAGGLSHIAVTFGHDRLLGEMADVFSRIDQTVSGGAQGNISIARKDLASKNYYEDLEFLEKTIKAGAARGMWRVSAYYAADEAGDARRLGNLIRAAFSGEESRPEPLRVIEYNRIREVLANSYMMADVIDDPQAHPLGRWYREGLAQPIDLYIYKFQTVLGSDQLATLCQLPTKEFPGFYLDQYVEFDVADRAKKASGEPIVLGDVCVAGRRGSTSAATRYTIEKNDLTRHALIIGITGGGKTNTAKSVLDTLWNEEKVPFLVIESAKREYWELRNQKGFEDLLVFTLGAEDERGAVRYRINPFECDPHTSLQTHIDYLLSTFKAAFDLYPPMPYILEKAVYEVYSDRGWDIVENINRLGLTTYPTLSDLYDKIEVIVEDLGYHQEVSSNVRAALQARIYSLMIGGKGAMMDTPRSVPIGELLSRPVVMELEDLGDDETRSFVIGLLLVQLYEYRKAQMTKGSKKLSHILMVEEAHRLLKNVPESGEGGNSRAKSVEFFCNMLAEIRTYGQGILIADQIPTKLAPDTIKNTNLKIVHRTVAQEDREAIGRAMNMSAEQIDYLSSLRRGYAAVYAEGDSRPKCVRFPLVEPFYDKDRAAVIAEVRKKVNAIASGYDERIRHHAGCSFCEQHCRHRAQAEEFVRRGVDSAAVLSRWQERRFAPASLAAFLGSNLVKNAGITDPCAQLCVLGFLLARHEGLNDGQRQRILSGYLKYQQQHE